MLHPAAELAEHVAGHVLRRLGGEEDPRALRADQPHRPGDGGEEAVAPGTIVGTVLGVLIFATFSQVFTLNNLSTSAQAVIKGVIIVLAVLLQQRFASRGSRQT